MSKGTLCPKGLSQHCIVRAENRVKTPLIKRNGKLESSSWEDAFLKVSDKFKEVALMHGKGAVACISTGQLLTEEFFTLGKFVQLGLGTNNFDGNTTLCMSSAVMGYKQSFGSDGPPGCYEDFSHADVIMLIGANISDNHPILKLHIAKNRSKTIIWEQGWADEEFMRESASGYKEFVKHIQYPPAEVANITGIEVKELYELARVYAGADKAMSAWTMGVNQSKQGTDTVSAICNLALMTGNIERVHLL